MLWEAVGFLCILMSYRRLGAGVTGRGGSCIEVYIVFYRAVYLIFQGQDQEAGAEHEEGH